MKRMMRCQLWRNAVIALAVSVGSGLIAQDQNALLPQSQWKQRIGASVSDKATLQQTLAQIADSDRVEFTQRALRAVSRMPVRPEARAARFVQVSSSCIAAANAEVRQKVIAEVFAQVPVDYLPAVTEELAKRFDQDYNKLTKEQYEKIASETLGVVYERNASRDVDAASVRNIFAILAFLKGSKDPAALQSKLIAQLPEERVRNLAALWIPPALKDGNYDALLAAADVDELPLERTTFMRLIGDPVMDRLLIDLNTNLGLAQAESDSETAVEERLNLPLSDVRTAGEGLEGSRASAYAGRRTDYGINRVPRTEEIRGPDGYQNQTYRVIDTLPLRNRR